MNLQEYLTQKEPLRRPIVKVEKCEIEYTYHGKLINPISKKITDWYNVNIPVLDKAYPQHTGGFHYLVEKGTHQLWTIDNNGIGSRSVFMLNVPFNI